MSTVASLRGMKVRVFGDSGLPRAIAALTVLAAAVASCGSPRQRSSPDSTGSRASLLLVTIDTLRADHLGCYGYGAAETPAIDAVAAEGVRFEHASSAVPLTLPSHATILTGMYPPAHGARNNGMYRLPDEAVTLTEILRGRGYRTGAFVGAYPVASPFGLGQGFEVYDERFHPVPGEGIIYPQRRADEVTAAARAWIGSLPREQPFFAWVHCFDPHADYDPPQPWASRFAESPYDGEIAYTDSNLGSLFDFLRRTGRWNDTLVIITADHGESLGEHGEETHGLFVYEATMHVPLIVKPPDTSPRPAAAGGEKKRGAAGQGSVIEELVSLVDLFPTALDLLGATDRGSDAPPVQGVSLAARIRGEAAPPGEGTSRSIYSESLMPRLEYGWAELTSLRRGRLKWIEAPRPELYDLSADPTELRNLADEAAAARSGAGTHRASALPGEAVSLRADLATLRASLSVAGVEERSRRSLDAEEIQKLQSLGYLQGGAIDPGTSGPERAAGGPSLRDPKDGVVSMRRIDEAKELAREHRVEESLALFRRVVDDEPGNLTAKRLLASSLIVAERPKEADALLAKVSVKGTQTWWLPRLRGRAREAMGDDDAALTFYKEAMRREPDPTPPAVKAAMMLRRKGMIHEAIDIAEQALAAGGDRATIGEMAGDLARDAGDIPRAAKHYRAALSANPTLDGAWRNYARAAFAVSLPDDVEGLRALAASAGDIAGARLVAGLLDYTAGHPREAAASLRRAHELAPDDADIACFLALSLMDSGELSGAEEILVPLLSRKPDVFPARRALGLLREKQGRPEEATSELRRALALRPGDPVARGALERVSRR